MRSLPASVWIWSVVTVVLGSSCSPDEETVLRLDVENASRQANGLRVSLALTPPRQFEAQLVGRYQRLSLPLGDIRTQTVELGLEVLEGSTLLGASKQAFTLGAGFSPPVRIRIDERGQPSLWGPEGPLDAGDDTAPLDSGASDANRNDDGAMEPDALQPDVVRPSALIWSMSGSRPVIDGHAEEVWINALARGYDFPHLIVEDGVAAPTAAPRARWAGLRDSLGLYLFVQVEDDSLVVDGSKGPSVPDDAKEPWEDDSIEIFLDGDRMPATGLLDNVNDGILQIRFGENFVRSPDADRVSRVVPVPGYQVAWQVASNGYSFEAFFPAQQLGVDPKPGRAILIDLHVNDDDAGDLEFKSRWKTSWASKVNQTFNNKELWGQATFVAEALQPRIEIPRMSPPTIDGNAQDWPASRWPLTHLHQPASERAGPLSPDDLHATLAVGGDEAALYFVVEVTDDVASIQDFHPWFDDVVEIVMSPEDPTANAAPTPATRLFFRANASNAAQPPDHNTDVDLARVAFAWQVVSPTRRRLEVALPWSLWPQSPSQSVFGIDVVVWDDDEGDGIAKHRAGWMSKGHVPAVGPFPRRLLGTAKLALPK